jgi:hypothetical protein
VLDCGVPETLRKMMVAGRKADLPAAGIDGESERESEHDRRSVRPPALPRELECVEIAHPRRAEGRRIRGCVTSLEQDHVEAFAALERIAMKGAERERARAMRHDLLRFLDGQQLEIESGKLDDAVVRSPGMPITSAHGKAEALVKCPGRIEIADGVNNMIETARHDRVASLRYRIDESVIVGCGRLDYRIRARPRDLRRAVGRLPLGRSCAHPANRRDPGSREVTTTRLASLIGGGLRAAQARETIEGTLVAASAPKYVELRTSDLLAPAATFLQRSDVSPQARTFLHN